MQAIKNENHKFGLQSVLILTICSLVLLAMLALGAVSYLSSRSIVGDFGSLTIVGYLDRLERALHQELDALVYQANFVSQALVSGRYSFAEPQRLADFASGSMAAAPQIGDITIGDGKDSAIEVARTTSNHTITKTIKVSDRPELLKIAKRAQTSRSPFWIEPFYSSSHRSSLIGLCIPVRYENRYLGFVVVSIFSQTLSVFVDELSDLPRRTAFMLFGPNHVLAHPQLARGSPKLSTGNPLLALDQLGDAVLIGLPDGYSFREAGIELPEGSEALIVDQNDKHYQVYMRTIESHEQKPLVIGIYLSESIFNEVIETLGLEALIGVALLIFAIILAILLSKMIARSIVRAANAALAIRTFDFERVPTLRGSKIAEVDNLARSLNRAFDGLKSFGRYVPRKLVARLIKEGRADAGSEERALSVMFTDIAGFSALCETMSAGEVAQFINEHLSLVSKCIDDKGGTIDKYIGDAVMAFWGAPDTLENTALPACRAATAVRSAIFEDNKRRRSVGLEPVRIRIGIHTGPLVVGDIGAPERINYTVVGDVVNGGQRLEGLGKEVDPHAEVIILISGATAELLPKKFPLTSIGSFKVKGKEQRLDVFQLN